MCEGRGYTQNLCTFCPVCCEPKTALKSINLNKWISIQNKRMLKKIAWLRDFEEKIENMKKITRLVQTILMQIFIPFSPQWYLMVSLLTLRFIAISMGACETFRIGFLPQIHFSVFYLIKRTLVILGWFQSWPHFLLFLTSIKLASPKKSISILCLKFLLSADTVSLGFSYFLPESHRSLLSALPSSLQSRSRIHSLQNKERFISKANLLIPCENLARVTFDS